MVGILAFGAYVPRLRLQRQAVAAAHAWFNPALTGNAKGERAMANWDEDCITRREIAWLISIGIECAE